MVKNGSVTVDIADKRQFLLGKMLPWPMSLGLNRSKNSPRYLNVVLRVGGS